MIKLTTENTTKAIERCKQVKPIVRYIAERFFQVSSSDKQKFYDVRFFVNSQGEKFGECSCKATTTCFHIIAGATANIYRQGLKRQA